MLLQNINSILKEKARTSVFVAHRLRTIYDSDRIIVLHGGKVAESGTHSQLIDTGGVYSELWSGKCSFPMPFCQAVLSLVPTKTIFIQPKRHRRLKKPTPIEIQTKIRATWGSDDGSNRNPCQQESLEDPRTFGFVPFLDRKDGIDLYVC